MSGIIPSQLYCNHIQLAEWQSSLHCFGGEEMCHLTFCMFSGDKLAPSSLSSCQCFPFHPTPFPKFLFPVFLWLSGQIFREQSMGGKTQPYWLPSPGRDCDPIKGIHSHILGDGVVVEGLRLRLNFFYRLWMLHSHQCTVWKYSQHLCLLEFCLPLWNYFWILWAIAFMLQFLTIFNGSWRWCQFLQEGF